MNTAITSNIRKGANYSTEQPVHRRKKSAAQNRTTSIESQKEKLNKKHRSKSAGKKKKSRSKSKKKAKKQQSIHIAVIKAEDKKLNVTSFVPQRRTHKERLSQTNAGIRKCSLSASSRQRMKRISLSETSEDSHSLKSCNKSHHTHSSRKSSKSKRKRSETKRSDLGHHSSKEFTLMGSQDRRAQQKLRQIELQEELFDSRNQLKQYKQIVYDMKRQLDKASQQQEDILAQQQKHNQYIQKAEKYKSMAKEYRKEVNSLRNTIETEKAQKEEREAQRAHRQEQVHKKQDAIINEMVINLQRMQLLANHMDQNGEISNQINEIFHQLANLHHIANAQIDLSHQVSASDILQDFQNLHSNINSEGGNQTQQLSQTYLSTSRLGDLSQNGLMNPSSQTQALSYSIFSPQFMKSSDRNATQGLSNHSHQQETEPNQVLMDNFTLTWDQSAHAVPNTHGQANLKSQVNSSGVTHSQQAQIELLLRIQQEMAHLRDRSQRITDENQGLRAQNDQLQEQLQHFKKSQRGNHHSKQLNEAMDDIRQTNEKLIRKIEELESNQKSSKVTEEHLQVMQNMIRRYEAENIDLKDEQSTHLRQIQSLQRSQSNQDKMLNLMINNRHAEQSQSQILPDSQALSHMHSRSQNLSQPLTEQESTHDNNQPYIITNASQEHLSRQRNNSSILDRFKEGGSSLNSSKVDQLGSRSYLGQLPLAVNASQTKMNQSASIYIETGTHDKDRHLFSLSSTQPENLGMILGGKENLAPKHLDFNQLNDRENLVRGTVFSLIKPPQATIQTISQKTEGALTNMIKIEDTLRYSNDPTNRGVTQDKSTLNLSNTNPMIAERRHDQNNRTYTQESDRRIPQINVSSASDKNNFSRSNYQQVNYTDSSEQSYSRHRYLNFDSKNVTQQLPHQVFIQDSMNSQETLQGHSQSHHFLKPLSRTATIIGKNQKSQSSQKALTMIHQFSSSKDLSNNKSLNDGKTRSPTFQSQQLYNNNKIGSDRENYNLENLGQQIIGMGFGGQDFSNIMFNYTGTLSHEDVPISTQGNQQTAPHLHEDMLEHLPNQMASGQTSTNNNSMSVRTINLKKEINSLDQEIIMLQNSLKDALNRKEPIMSLLH